MPLSIDIVIPVLNEQHALPRCIKTLRGFLLEAIPNQWRIVIADNGSEDDTPRVIQQLVNEHQDVVSSRLEQRGRGRALRQAWMGSSADIVSYMDVDLSTDLTAFPPLIGAIEGGYDIAVGSRLASKAQVHGRSTKREVTSRCYNILIKGMFLTHFSDAQCGFKALTSTAARVLVPYVADQGWFFDTELLILAEKLGFRIKDIPVNWTDDPDTRVNVIRTVLGDLRGLLRLRFSRLPPAPR